MIVLGIDPGVSTGLAALVVDKPELSRTYAADSIAGIMGFVEDIPNFQRIVLENYVFQPGTHISPTKTLMVIGAVHYMALMRDVRLIVQNSQYRKPYLEHAEAMLPGRTRHEIDAMAHAISRSA